MNRFDRFRELLDEPAPAAQRVPPEDLVQPLRDLAEALKAGAHVGADVIPSKDGRKLHLALWPLHRPAFRSLMVTIHVADGRGAVLGDPVFWFATADALTDWLENFIQGPAFRSTLDSLRLAATDPIDARLERGNGMATLATVTPTQQEALDALQIGMEHAIELPLQDRQPLPEPSALRLLDSAGLRFEIREARFVERVAHLRIAKLA